MNEVRQRIIALICEINQMHPELRIGQLLSNAAQYGNWKSCDLFYLPDMVLLQGLELYLSKLKRSESNE